MSSVNVSVSQFTKRNFVTAGPFTGIHELKPQLLTESAVVIMDGELFLGVLTPADVVRKPHRLAVDCLKAVASLNPRHSIETALQIMAAEKTDVLPVLKAQNLEGLVFKNDILKYLNNNNRALQTQLQSHKKRIEKIVAKRTRALSSVVVNKNKFIGIIAHELRSPFAVIHSLLGLLLKDLHKYDQRTIESSLNNIYQSTTVTYELMVNLLEWLDSKSDKIQFNPVGLDIHQLLIEEIKSTVNFAEKKGITIHSDILANTYVYADSNMLKTVFRNLINNAIKFSFPGGQVFIHSFGRKNEIEITIKDDGVGLTPEIKAHIFEEGLGSTHGTNDEIGSGIGLLICKEFIELGGGQIWAESNPHQGAEFKFTLPRFINPEQVNVAE